MRSARGSSPKISSESSTEPEDLPSKDWTFSSMSRALLLNLRAGRRWLFGAGLGQTELAGLRRILRQRLLHGITHRDPAALGAGHRALNQDQAAINVGLHDLQIERGHPIDTHVAGHLLVLEGLAGILTAAGRADRTVRDRDTVRGAQTAEIPALHTAGKALADRRASDVDILADDEVIGGDLGTNRDQLLFVDAELGQLALGLDLGDGEVAAQGLAEIVGPTG